MQNKAQSRFIIEPNCGLLALIIIVMQRCEKIRHRAEVLMGWAARARTRQVM